MKTFNPVVVLFLTCSLFAQSNSVSTTQNQNMLHFDLDYARFRDETRNIYLELYYSFSRSQFAFVEQDSQKVAMFNIEVRIFQQDTLIFSRDWFGRSTVSEEDGVKGHKQWYTLTNFVLPAGNYRLVTKVKDVNSEREGSKELDLELNTYAKDKLSLSDIQLANSIVQDTVGGLFTKNYYRVIPNPSLLYGLERPMLYFYAEIYNLSVSRDSTYQVEYAILDNQRNAFRTYPANIRKQPGTSLVEVGGVNVISLPTGMYFLELKVTDLGNSSQVTQQKKFYVYGKDKALPTLPRIRVEVKGNPLIEFYKSLSQEAIDEEFATATHIALPEEKRIFETLDLDGKREFMARFWRKRDTVTETAKNEFRDNYLARVKFANEHFGGAKKGWKTDRGRILLTYGQPDEVERNPSLGESRGYEIWRYFAQYGGILFVFVDQGGWQDLQLVHSTARGEIYDLDWKRWISVQ